MKEEEEEEREKGRRREKLGRQNSEENGEGRRGETGGVSRRRHFPFIDSGDCTSGACEPAVAAVAVAEVVMQTAAVAILTIFKQA